jgi:hypothetical protein
MLHRYILPLIIFLILVLAAATPARADVVQLFSPGELTPPLVTTDYPNIPPGFVGSVLTPPLVVFAGGSTVTFTTGVPPAAGGRLLRVNQGVGFLGDFAAGTELLVTENGSGVPSGPLTISFSIPVFAFGLNAQNTFFESGQTSTFTFSLFNGATLLGTFTQSGLDDSGTFFLGARAIFGQSITHFTISGASTISDLEARNNFAIGPVQFQPIPEPATMLLLGAGLAGLAGARWRKRRVKPE